MLIIIWHIVNILFIINNKQIKYKLLDKTLIKFVSHLFTDF